MDNFDMENRMRSAAEELLRMQRDSIPPMPPFVRTPSNEPRHEPPPVAPAEAPPTQSPPPPPPAPEPEPPQAEPRVELPPKSEKKGGLFGKDILKFLDLKNMQMDSDRMLLLLMILLLSGENSDEMLLFALAYIML